MVFTDDMEVITYKDSVLLLNSCTGLWIRISKYVYDIFNFAIEKKYDRARLLEQLYDDKDREYINEVYRTCINLNLMEPEKNREKDKSKTKVRGERVVLLEVTHRCNLKCAHCCVDASDNMENEMSFENLAHAINEILKWNPSQVMLTGGEPLVRTDFISILKYLRNKYKGKIVLLTNGILIDQGNVDMLTKLADKISISMDGVDEESCSRIRGKGVFGKVLRAVDLLHRNQYYNIELSMISDKFHKKMDQAFAELNHRLETTPVIRTFTPIGRGRDNNTLLEDMDDHKYYSKTPYINKEVFGACNCTAGRQKVLIDYKGDIYPCQYFHEDENCLGNILKDGIGIVNNNENRILKYFPQYYEKCRKCDVNRFCWPCPGELKIYTQKDMENKFEEICHYMKPVLYQKIWGEEIDCL